MLPRPLVKYPDTKTYMEALSGRNIYHVLRSEGQQGNYTAVLSLGCKIFNIDNVAS